MSLSTKIAGSGDTLLFCIEFREPNMSSAMAPSNSSIIDTLLDVVKPMIKLILLDLKSRKANHFCICSSTPTAEEIIKQTQIHVSSRNINLTITGITRNNRNFVKTGVTQFAQL